MLYSPPAAPDSVLIVASRRQQTIFDGNGARRLTIVVYLFFSRRVLAQFCHVFGRRRGEINTLYLCCVLHHDGHFAGALSALSVLCAAKRRSSKAQLLRTGVRFYHHTRHIHSKQDGTVRTAHWSPDGNALRSRSR